jgi:hypothetical protein
VYRLQVDQAIDALFEAMSSIELAGFSWDGPTLMTIGDAVEIIDNLPDASEGARPCPCHKAGRA